MDKMEALNEEDKIKRLAKYKKDAPFYPEENKKIREILSKLKNPNELEKKVSIETLNSYKGRCFYTFCPIHKYDTTSRKAKTITIKDKKETTRVSFHEEVCFKELLSDLELDKDIPNPEEEMRIHRYFMCLSEYGLFISRVSIKFINL